VEVSYGPNSTTSICCGLVGQQVAQQAVMTRQDVSHLL